MKSENPDKIILHDITECECCKSELLKEGELNHEMLLDFIGNLDELLMLRIQTSKKDD